MHHIQNIIQTPTKILLEVMLLNQQRYERLHDESVSSY